MRRLNLYLAILQLDLLIALKENSKLSREDKKQVDKEIKILEKYIGL